MSLPAFSICHIRACASPDHVNDVTKPPGYKAAMAVQPMILLSRPLCANNQRSACRALPG